jgi:beta-galactosidase
MSTIPVTGHFQDKETMMKDIRLMKQFKYINAVCSHYPNNFNVAKPCNHMDCFIEEVLKSHGMGAELQGPFDKQTPGLSPEWKAASYGSYL